MIKTPLAVLQKYFHYSFFRPNQEKIIQAILDKKSILAIMPTGGGKSICFQIPGLIFDGLTLVISPLISLMKDQVDQLEKLGISATYLNSSLSKEQLNQTLKEIANQKYKFIYLAPERLLKTDFLELCQKINISFVVIDEAHCLSLWGHDFRPSYLNILAFIKLIKQKPTISAFTATANNETKNDLLKQLNLSPKNVFCQSFMKENLTIVVNSCRSVEEKNLNLFKIISQHSHENGIIYVTTKRQAEILTKIINQVEFFKKPCYFYHGALEKEKKNLVQELFLTNKTSLIVATNAFGMGINKSNINYIVHYQIPSNLENYYQEIGRAGRDQSQANCYLLYYEKDLKINFNFINQPHLLPERKKILYQKLEYMQKFCLTQKCRMQFILHYFNEITKTKCLKCDNCCLPIKEKSKNVSFKIFLSKLSLKKNCHPYLILNNTQQQLILLLKPQTQNQYLKIPGIGDGWLKEFYSDFQNFFINNKK